jgi:hypothetical protein
VDTVPLPGVVDGHSKLGALPVTRTRRPGDATGRQARHCRCGHWPGHMALAVLTGKPPESLREPAARGSYESDGAPGRPGLASGCTPVLRVSKLAGPGATRSGPQASWDCNLKGEQVFAQAVTRPIMMPVPLRAVLMPAARASGFGGGTWDRHWQPK